LSIFKWSAKIRQFSIPFKFFKKNSCLLFTINKYFFSNSTYSHLFLCIIII